MDINALKAARADALKRAEAVALDAEKENRDLSDDESAVYDGAMTEARSFGVRIERAAEMDKEAGIYPADAPQPNIDMEPRQVREYSLMRAIRAQADGNWREAGLEKECSDAVAEKFDKQPKGFFLPHDIQTRATDLTKVSGTGDQIVATDLKSGNYIDILRNKMMVKQAGATVLAGLVGEVAIPAGLVGTDAAWVAEDVAHTQSDTSYRQVTLTPKSVSAWQNISRKLMLQSTPDVDKLVMNDLAATIAVAIDAAALHGPGTAAPTGIASTVGIGSVAGGANGLAPAWSHIVDLETEVAVDNADVGNLAYMTSPLMRGELKQILRVASTDSRMLWADGNFPLNGYKTFITNQVSDTLTKGTSTAKCSAIFYGNWADILIGMWGSLDLLVNPFILDTTGQIRLTAFQDVDVAVRHAESFSAMLDALPV
jgi:HK97 family phage major capsid protein